MNLGKAGTNSNIRDDEEEEVEIKLSPTGSVLVPATNPYDKYQKIREANEALQSDPGSVDVSRFIVHFNEEVTVLEDEQGIDEDIFEAEDSETVILENAEDENFVNTNEEQEKKNAIRTLHVTVPTCCYQYSEEILSEEDTEKEIEIIKEKKNYVTSKECEKFNEIDGSGSETGEEVEDETLPLPNQDEEQHPDVEVETSDTEHDDEISSIFEKSISIEESKSKNREAISLPNSKNIIEKVDKRNEKNTSAYVAIASESKKSAVRFSGIKNNSNIAKKEESNKNRKTELPRIENRKRPSTAPVKRTCCQQSAKIKLPVYNGYRSEYGLSEDQLKERETKKLEYSRALRLEKERKYLEEKQKQKENDIKFNNWLVRKKREDAENNLKKLKQYSNFYMRTTTPAPTYHLGKIGLLRNQILRREKACFLFDDILKNVKPQKQRTYRIYLGLCIDD